MATCSIGETAAAGLAGLFCGLSLLVWIVGAQSLAPQATATMGRLLVPKTGK